MGKREHGDFRQHAQGSLFFMLALSLQMNSYQESLSKPDTLIRPKIE